MKRTFEIEFTENEMAKIEKMREQRNKGLPASMQKTTEQYIKDLLREMLADRYRLWRNC